MPTRPIKIELYHGRLRNAREAYRRRVTGGTLDTGGPGPVVGDHLGVDGVHRVFRDASPDWTHPYLSRAYTAKPTCQTAAGNPSCPIHTNDSPADEYRHDIPLTARDQAIIALAAAAVTALILRAVTRRWWWTA